MHYVFAATRAQPPDRKCFRAEHCPPGACAHHPSCTVSCPHCVQCAFHPTAIKHSADPVLHAVHLAHAAFHRCHSSISRRDRQRQSSTVRRPLAPKNTSDCCIVEDAHASQARQTISGTCQTQAAEQSAEQERSIRTLTDQHQAASDCVQAARRKRQSMPHPSFVT
jgi:hypothetical protein